MKRFQDLKPGDSFQSVGETAHRGGHPRVSPRRYDPQPFHVDAVAAKAGPFGGLIASGIHTLARDPAHDPVRARSTSTNSAGLARDRGTALAGNPCGPAIPCMSWRTDHRGRGSPSPGPAWDRPLQPRRDQPEGRDRHDAGERRVHAHLEFLDPAPTQIALPESRQNGAACGGFRLWLRHSGREEPGQESAPASPTSCAIWRPTLGAKIFERHRQRLRPTMLGTFVIGQARVILHDMDGADHQLEEFRARLAKMEAKERNEEVSAEAGETHRIGLTQVIPAETPDGRERWSSCASAMLPSKGLPRTPPSSSRSCSSPMRRWPWRTRCARRPGKAEKDIMRSEELP